MTWRNCITSKTGRVSSHEFIRLSWINIEMMAIDLHYDGSRHDPVTLTATCQSSVSCGWLRLSDWLDLGAG